MKRLLRFLPALFFGHAMTAATLVGAAPDPTAPTPVVVPDYNAIDYHQHPECAVPPRNTQLQIDADFSSNNAYLMILTSALTEEKPSLIYDQLHSWGFESPTVWTHPWFGLRMIVAEHQDFTLVAFRGTTVIADYISNAMFDQKDASGLFAGNAHRGFWGVFERTHQRLQDLILRAGGDRKPVLFTGHSRGGVFAVLSAVNFRNQGGQVAAVYTFAQPRIGDDALAAYIDKRVGDRYYRMDIDRDITPQIPPTRDVAGRLHAAGYLHKQLANYVESLNYGYDPGTLFVLPESGGLWPVTSQRERADAFWLDFYQRLLDGKPLQTLPEVIKDFPVQHNTDLYICRLLESI